MTKGIVDVLLVTAIDHAELLQQEIKRLNFTIAEYSRTNHDLRRQIRDVQSAVGDKDKLQPEPCDMKAQACEASMPERRCKNCGCPV